MVIFHSYVSLPEGTLWYSLVIKHGNKFPIDDFLPIDVWEIILMEIAHVYGWGWVPEGIPNLDELRLASTRPAGDAGTTHWRCEKHHVPRARTSAAECMDHYKYYIYILYVCVDIEKRTTRNIGDIFMYCNVLYICILTSNNRKVHMCACIYIYINVCLLCWALVTFCTRRWSSHVQLMWCWLKWSLRKDRLEGMARGRMRQGPAGNGPNTWNVE